MNNYITLSLELHLFFLRIMKEHSLFLEAGFLARDEEFIRRSEWFREQFEELLRETVKISNGMIGQSVLDSQEIVTPHTKGAEEKTCKLSGLPIDTQITVAEHKLQCKGNIRITRAMQMTVRSLNRRALRLVRGLIELKENILHSVNCCELFTFNYPLLIEHILREARLYGSFLMELEQRGTISRQCRRETEIFWNQIMMEHAMFIRGLLDPSEAELIDAADGFAKEYACLLEEAREKDCTVTELTQRTIAETRKYQEFKTAGTKGILNCEISSLILPLLADHVLREANHYLRLLEENSVKEGRGDSDKIQRC